MPKLEGQRASQAGMPPIPQRVMDSLGTPEKQAAAEKLWAKLQPLAEKLGGEKFDLCISNPPYQESTQRENGSIAQAENIFHHFYSTGISIANTTAMIFPGGRWMQRGSQAAFDAIMPTAQSVYWYPNSSDTPTNKRIFPGVDIIDGVSIVVGKPLNGKPSPTINLNGVEIPRPTGDGILPLGEGSAALLAKLPKENIMGRRASTGVFGLRTYYVERNPKNVAPAIGARGNKLAAPKRFKNPIQAYLGNEVPGSGKKTQLYWMDESSVDWAQKNRRTLADSWKVVMTQAGANKHPETRKVWVVPAGIVVGETLNILGYFPTEEEANNYSAYLSTPLVKHLLYLSKGGHSKALGMFVPDLGDYTKSNDLFKGDGELPREHEYRGLTLEERLERKFELNGEDLTSIPGR